MSIKFIYKIILFLDIFFLLFFGRNIFDMISMESFPLIRTIPIPEAPMAVDMAAMVRSERKSILIPISPKTQVPHLNFLNLNLGEVL